MKRCSMCREMKDLTQFYNYKRSKDGRHYRCRACDKEYMKKYRPYQKAYRKKRNLATYNLTVEEFDALVAEQGGVCRICKQPDPQKIQLAVDHDHETGERRGLLCGRCNKGLGLFLDDPNLLLEALGYLQEYGKCAKLRTAIEEELQIESLS